MSEKWLWAPHDEKGYVVAKLLEGNSKSKTMKVEAREGAERLSVNPKVCYPIRDLASVEEIVTDLVHLADQNPASILNVLCKRLETDDIYTMMGAILIAVNPFKLIDGLYDMPILDRYLRADGLGGELPPHVFAIAANAFITMRRDNQNQVRSPYPARHQLFSLAAIISSRTAANPSLSVDPYFGGVRSRENRDHEAVPPIFCRSGATAWQKGRRPGCRGDGKYTE